MKRFQHRFVVRASLAEVADFHRDTKVLRLLTPPPVIVQFHNVEPLGEGSIADFTLWLGPLPVRWRALHSQVDLQRGFVDTQARGPFAHWVHTHRFTALGEHTTEVMDEVVAQPAGLVSWGLWLSLPLLFAYRGWVTRRQVERRGNRNTHNGFTNSMEGEVGK